MQKVIVPPTPLTDDEVAKTLADVEDVIRFRLKMSEVIPIEMSKYRIGNNTSSWKLRLLTHSAFQSTVAFISWSQGYSRFLCVCGVQRRMLAGSLWM